MKNDEPHIISEILAGKVRRYDTIVDRYSHQVFSLIVRVVQNAEEAEELTQDTFLKAFQNLTRFHGDSSFSTWLYRIAYNTALTAARKQQVPMVNFEAESLADLSDAKVDEMLDDPNPTERMLNRLQCAIDMLSPEERVIVTLFYLEDRPIAEISRIVGIKEGTLKVRLLRIRKKLYLLITQMQDDND